MKTSNYIIIFLAGFIVAVVIVGGGFSYINASNNVSTVVEDTGTDKIIDEDGNEYVVEAEDPLKITVINDNTCERCSSSKLEKGLRSQIGRPLAVRRLNYQNEEAKSILANNNATFLPYILFDDGVEQQQNFAHLTHHTITQANEGYYLDLVKMGEVVGRYLDATYYEKGDDQAPRMRIEETSYDFGDVRLVDGKVSTEFVIKNEGLNSLEFLNADTSCGCTSVSIDLGDNVSPEYMMAGHQKSVQWRGSLESGQEAKIVVYYDPSVHPDLNEEVTRSVTIDTNDPNMPQLKLKIYVNQVTD